MDSPDVTSPAAPQGGELDLRMVVEHLATLAPCEVVLVDAGDELRSRTAEDAAVVVPDLPARLAPADLIELLAVPTVRGLTVLSADPRAMIAVRQVAGIARAIRHPVIPGTLAPRRAEAAPGLVLDLRHRPLPRRSLLGRAQSAPSARSASERLVSAVGRLTGGVATPDLDRLPTGIPRWETQGCCENGACARICPVDALELIAPDDHGPHDMPRQWGLRVHDSVCIACGRCAQACPEQALVTQRSSTWSELLGAEPQPRLLNAGLREPCRRCGAPQRHQGGLCRICAQTAANPFAVNLPPVRGH